MRRWNGLLKCVSPAAQRGPMQATHSLPKSSFCMGLPKTVQCNLRGCSVPLSGALKGCRSIHTSGKVLQNVSVDSEISVYMLVWFQIL